MLAPGAGTKGKTLLPDDFSLRGVEGRLIKKDQDAWFFQLDSTENNKKAKAGTGEALNVLPSSTLERMIADVNDPVRAAAGYRLWATVTKYKGRNFIFPVNFLPLYPDESEEKPQAENLSTKSETGLAPSLIGGSVSEPNDELEIPKEILDKLKSGRILPSEGRKKSEESAIPGAGRQIQVKQNYVLVNRAGFLVKQADGSMVFSLDALGRSAGSTAGVLRLLPCQALELAERMQSAEPDRIRFKVAGVVTEYKGEEFLLLHRAVRTYNNGNLGR